MLDDLEFIKSVDKDAMLDFYKDYIHHFREAKTIAETALENATSLPNATGEKITSIVICGMGGSAISGDILAAIHRKKGKLPILVNRNYEIPGFVDEKTLVIALSYSGNTAETLSCVARAAQCGARIMAVSSGGKLEKLCTEGKHFHIRIPGNFQPRAALPYLLVPALSILNTLDQGPEREELNFLPTLESYLQGFLPETPEKINMAKRIASFMNNKLVFLYGPDCLAPSMRRFSTQIHENTETHAFWNVFPELCHNEIVAWGNSQLENEKFVLLFRDRKQESPLLQVQIDAAVEQVLEEKASVLQIELREDDQVLNLLYSIILGDLVSIYMAILREVDPSPVLVIQQLKEEMKKSGN